MAGRKRKPANERKRLRLEFRGSELDASRLAALAKKYELTPSETLRRLVREASEK